MIGYAGRRYARYLNGAIRDTTARRDCDSRVSLGPTHDPTAFDELERWRARLGADHGSSAIVEVSRPPATAVLVSGASDSGYGGGIVEMDGAWVGVAARGVFESGEGSRSSGCRELQVGPLRTGARRAESSIRSQPCSAPWWLSSPGSPSRIGHGPPGKSEPSEEQALGGRWPRWG